jgi:hypothetical protein
MIILNRERILLKIGTSIKKGTDQSVGILDFTGRVVTTSPSRNPTLEWSKNFTTKFEKSEHYILL